MVVLYLFAFFLGTVFHHLGLALSFLRVCISSKIGLGVPSCCLISLIFWGNPKKSILMHWKFFYSRTDTLTNRSTDQPTGRPTYQLVEVPFRSLETFKKRYFNIKLEIKYEIKRWDATSWNWHYWQQIKPNHTHSWPHIPGAYCTTLVALVLDGLGSVQS